MNIEGRASYRGRHGIEARSSFDNRNVNGGSIEGNDCSIEGNGGSIEGNMNDIEGNVKDERVGVGEVGDTGKVVQRDPVMIRNDSAEVGAGDEAGVKENGNIDNAG